MVLEIVGARYLSKDFGSTFYVWVSQIGVVMIALAIGYYTGGYIADIYRKFTPLSYLLILAGILTFFIPGFATPILSWLVNRHPIGIEIPEVWQKLDPVIGSSIVFLVPCTVLAMVSPFLIRLLAQDVVNVGRISGFVFAFSTIGGIVGVFVSGFVLMDIMRISNIFKLMGILIVALGIGFLKLSREIGSYRG